MLEGLIALLLFLLFLLEWPRFIRELEAALKTPSDPLMAKIRMARLKAGLTPWPDDDMEKYDE